MPSKVNFKTNRLSGIAISRDNILHIIEIIFDPIIAVVSLWSISFAIEGALNPAYLILSIIIFSLSYPSSLKIELPFWESTQKILISWFMLAFLLLLLGVATGYINNFYKVTLILWLIFTPILQILGTVLLKQFAPYIIQLQGNAKNTVIVGVTQRSMTLASKIKNSNYNAMRFMGYFEDRELSRLPEGINTQLLGKIVNLPNYVKANNINIIYISLPMVSQPRIINLLEVLKDTTASIYFVPDIFLTDLIQSRIDEIGDIPVVAVRETPFNGTNGLVKRSTDIVFTLLILLIISPILLIVALGVKLSSPGPLIFKQKRYGLNGEEIVVYKFRSMTTIDNGDNVVQATKNDQRVTSFGKFIRKTSLDELPQFFNVLQGGMSIVGPRPHAVAHNEMYRKLIKGYMIRHKVKPGITGWAQVNGLRGETEVLEKMQARVDYDIAYLRNWTPGLDIYIILKTVWVVFFKGQNSAY
jgi:putative colanic acid biosysnthesis UDP-glucose lipid carrier transferase